MELAALDIENFGCVGKRTVTFRPGLNVLHGPNETGKSTIARAIRFALLVQPKAADIEPWVPWIGGGDPTVSLSFRTDEDHWWRVRKVFRTTSASLERSVDGKRWEVEARSREVESRVRALLRWGIPEPGGKGRTTTESFLASALLADQDQVEAVFESDLQSDPADSGRAWILEAVQVAAADPLFKSVLQIVQAKVDEAFTPKGQQKRDAGSPFKKTAKEVADLQSELDAAHLEAQRSRQLTDRLTELQRRCAEAEALASEAETRRKDLTARRDRQRAHQLAKLALDDAERRLGAVDEAEKKLAAAAKVLADEEPALEGLKRAEETARAAALAATTQASAARKTKEAEVAKEEAAIVGDRESLRRRRARVDAEERRVIAERLETEIAALDRELAVLELVEPWQEAQELRLRLATLARDESRAAELRKDIREGLPDDAAIKRLRKLRNELDVATRGLAVGFAIEVTGAPSASIAVDGNATQARTPPFTFEAAREASITIGSAQVVVRGGAASARAAAERLRADWEEETSALFARLATPDLDTLEEVCRRSAAAKSEAARLGDPAAERARLAPRLVELEQRLASADPAAIERAAPAVAGCAKKKGERAKKHEEAVGARAQEEQFRKDLPAADGGVAEDASTINAAARALDAREQAVRAAKAALESHEAPDLLEAAARKAKAELDAAHKRLEVARAEHATWSARLAERRTAAGGIDLARLRSEESGARVDGPPVDDAAVDAALKAENEAAETRRRLGKEVDGAEGEVRGAGGAAAVERLAELDDALARAHARQARLQDEYEAWRLLGETLADAEKTQATHLGKVLAPSLAARFSELTSARYAGVELGPHLGMEGISVGGAVRDRERISVGTREQLATIFRLCLAETLKSAIVLDDQLVQSDPNRLRWFRMALRETAARGVQIVVLTCRPDDYLEPGEKPEPHVVALGDGKQ